MKRETTTKMIEQFTSAGAIGAQDRSFDRHYNTLQHPVENPDEILRELAAAEEQLARPEISRAVLRLVTDRSAIAYLKEHHDTVPEACIPIDHIDRPGSVLALFGQNTPERAGTTTDRDEMIAATKQEETPCPETQTDHLAFCRELGYITTHHVVPGFENQLMDLWGRTFGWTNEQIHEFIQDSSTPSAEQKYWFSATGLGVNGDVARIASVAMAERVDIKGFVETIPLFESSAWRTRLITGSQEAGLIIPTLEHLNQQIYDSAPNALITAQCNFASRSDRRGWQAGFVIPDRSLAPQILTQNVGVNDGKNAHPLRDFVVMVHQKEDAKPTTY